MTYKPRNGVVAYTAAALAIVAAIGTQVILAIQTWKTSAKVDTVEKVVVATAAKTDASAEKLTEIGHDTNSNLTKANDRIAALEKLLESRFKTETKKP